MSAAQTKHATTEDVWNAIRNVLKEAGQSSVLIFQCEIAFWRSAEDIRSRA